MSRVEEADQKVSKASKKKHMWVYYILQSKHVALTEQHLGMQKGTNMR